MQIFDFELTSEEVEKLMELDEGELGRSCQPFDGYYKLKNVTN